MAKTQKFSVIIDSSGALVGAFATPADKQGVDGVQSGIDAGPGQSLHEIEVPEEFSKLDGPDLLLKLGHSDSVKEILSSIPSSGFVPVQGASSQVQGLSDFSATQGAPGATMQVSDAAGVVAGQVS